MPALSGDQAALGCLRDIIRDMAKDIETLKRSNGLLRGELESSVASTEHWYNEHQKMKERNKCLQTVLKQHEDAAEYVQDKYAILQTELEDAIESTNHWHSAHQKLLEQAHWGRATFRNTIWRLVADRAALRLQLAQVIAFWNENVQYLDGYYLPAVRRDYKALKASIRK